MGNLFPFLSIYKGFPNGNINNIMPLVWLPYKYNLNYFIWKISIRKTNSEFQIVNSTLIDLPAPISINYWWNFGSLLGVCLLTQIISGVFLTIHYRPRIGEAFESVVLTIQDVNFGWLVQGIHARGASFFFICLYAHIVRGIYFKSFTLVQTWSIGVSIFFLVMGIAFLGYVLPWGQISFWGATVITGLITTLPYIGEVTLHWLWGGMAVRGPTLNRFLALHFLLPFILILLVTLHIIYLHKTGSKDPLSLERGPTKISFHPYFIYKDTIRIVVLLISLVGLLMASPDIFTDIENYSPASVLVTPPHIQPEWYFLFAYAILRSVPSKLGGVLALVSSIVVLWFLPFLYIATGPLSKRWYKIFIMSFFSTTILLTWVGSLPVEPPYIDLGQNLSKSYFLLLLAPFLISSNYYKRS